MRSLCAAAIAFLCLIPGGVLADTLYLSDGSELQCDVKTLTLVVGDEPLEIDRADIRMGIRRKDEWQILTTGGRLHVGTLKSVTIDYLGGERTFDGDTITSLRLARPKPEPDTPEKDDDGPTDEEAAERRELTPEEKEELGGLARKSAKLRERSIDAAGKIADEKREKLRETYEPQVKAAQRRLRRAEREMAKHVDDIEVTAPTVEGSAFGFGFSRESTVTGSPAASDALDEYRRAKAQYDGVVNQVRAIQSAIVQQERRRVRRINAYHNAITRRLRAGHPVPEETMLRAFSQALGRRLEPDTDD